ncbi:uncharacterized [Tachysurus ichikawai]
MALFEDKTEVDLTLALGTDGSLGLTEFYDFLPMWHNLHYLQSSLPQICSSNKKKRIHQKRLPSILSRRHLCAHIEHLLLNIE